MPAQSCLVTPVYHFPYMFTKTTIKPYISNKVVILNINIISELETNSRFALLTCAVDITKDGLHIVIRHDAKTNENWGRSYNVFCRIRSKERLQLGYISYDMNAALQSISLQLVGATEADYPMLWHYTSDKEYKKQIRGEIANDLGIEISEVKEKLTAFANGSITGKSKHKYYKAFYVESDKLRREVLKYASESAPDVLKRAIEQSKRDIPKELDWTDTDIRETSAEMRNKASVFFFVWTWYERLIRQAMLTVLTDGIELHDAVYSKMDVDIKTIEAIILERTGFKVLIGKEIPKQ